MPLNSDHPRPPVFLPHNEPYLGEPALLEFDRAIPPAMRMNVRLAQGTFDRELSPIEQAAAQLVPQAVPPNSSWRGYAGRTVPKFPLAAARLTTKLVSHHVANR